MLRRLIKKWPSRSRNLRAPNSNGQWPNNNRRLFKRRSPSLRPPPTPPKWPRYLRLPRFLRFPLTLLAGAFLTFAIVGALGYVILGHVANTLGLVAAYIVAVPFSLVVTALAIAIWAELIGDPL